MVTASGCAPPIPPQPPVKVSVPASVPPNLFAATAANVSYVPCRIPCVPMYIHEPAVICPYIVNPRCSSRRNSGHVAQSPTRLELAINTRGAHSWVRITPTGRPDCTSIVSSSFKLCSVRTIASNESQSRAAFPVPPYTTRSSGRSATCGSRLFISIRIAASCGQPKHDRVVPRGARTGRGPLKTVLPSRQCSDHRLGCAHKAPCAGQVDSGLDLRRQPPIDVPPCHAGTPGRNNGRGARSGQQWCAQVQSPCCSENFDRDHLGQTVDGTQQFAARRPSHG